MEKIFIEFINSSKKLKLQKIFNYFMNNSEIYLNISFEGNAY